MAKKVLTPEQQEIKAIKKQKSSQNWTKFWAILLALVLTLGIAYLGKSQGEKNKPKAVTTVQGGDQTANPQDSSDDPAVAPTPADDDPAVAPTPADNNDGKDEKPADNAAKDEAAVAALINKVTGEAVAQKVGYDWARNCKVSNINVGNATVTKIVDGVIKTFDKNASIDSVVGGFLGNGNSKYTVKKGETLDTLKVTKDDGSTEPYYHGGSYTLKATSLKAEDIKNLKINGNQYSFTLSDCQNPDRSGNVALSRFTNDIVVKSEVEEELKGFTDKISIPDLQANYKNIKCTVTIKDDKLVELTYSFAADAQLGVKVAIATANGTGNLTTSAKYSNFKY